MFLEYFTHIRKLQFCDQPDYSYLKDNFTKLMIKNMYIYDFKYDWCIKKVIYKVLHILNRKMI